MTDAPLEAVHSSVYDERKASLVASIANGCSLLLLDYCALTPSLIRQLMNSAERMSPWPVFSTLNTSILEDLSFLRTRHTPSSTIIAFKTVSCQMIPACREVDLQSSNEEAKLIHMFPSHVPLPRLLTVPGIEAVSISSIRFKNPSGVRNPTIIFGTPRRKD